MSQTLLLLLLAGAFGQVGGVGLEGRVVDQSGLALPGVTVRLVSPSGAASQSVVTGPNGEYRFDAPPGEYRVEAALDGFEPASQPIRLAAAMRLPDIVLTIGRFTQQTTVVAAVPTEITPRQFGAPATIAEKVIDNAPLRTNRYDDVLPLLPNVVRGPDGLVSVAGARAPQGVVLLNGVPGIDVASGEPAAPVPLAAVKSVQVITTGFPAEYARSTAGVTIVNTRSGSDEHRFSANSFTPRPRFDHGGIQGIEAWEPNTGIRGPLSPGRAWYAQSLDYRFERTKVTTLAGEQDRRLKGLTSLTQLDFRTSPSHVVTAWFSGQARRVEGAGLSAFDPLGTVPISRRSTWGGALVDRATLSPESTLETRFELRHQDRTLRPTGALPSVVGHDITRGSYFGTVDREAVSVQAASVFSRVWSGSNGRGHLFKAGGSVARETLDGSGHSSPVTYLRSNGTLARRVEFVGAGVFAADTADAGMFVQDTWTLSSRFVADLGLRADWAAGIGGVTEPRAGVTWKPGDNTTVTGGIGVFADKVLLAALAFPDSQSRLLTRFDADGVPIGSPVLYANMQADRLQRARAWIWNAQLDRHLGTRWLARAAYQERRGSHEFVVVPIAATPGEELALLDSAGVSRSRSAEFTLGFRPTRSAHQFYVSYVRASTRGSVNDFNQVEGAFREPLLESAQDAPLPIDVPHRLLAWGLFALPAETTVAPFLEVRSGFPFSPVADDWSYAGPRNSRRYPAFASLDLVVNKMVTLPRGVRARLGVKLYNVAGRRNGRDIQRDIERVDFGRTYNALGRQLRGVFEIVWNGNRK